MSGNIILNKGIYISVASMATRIKEENLRIKAVRGPLRFPGGKTRVVPKIFPLIPTFGEYREPMVGGGSVFLTLKKKYPERSFWINDFNHDLFSFWNACKEVPETLVNEAIRIKRQDKPGKDIFREWRVTNIELTDFERGLRFYLLNRIAFSGLVDTGGYSEASYNKRFTEKSTQSIIQTSKLLKDVKITNSSYELLLREPGDEVFIYLDPPYIGNTESKLYGKKGELHMLFNHRRLREELKRCPYNWLLTYDDTTELRDSYAFANIYEGQVAYGMNNAGKLKRAARGNELFICNYDLKQSTLKVYGLAQV